MIDPLLSLAFTVQSNPGIYALLLGSGVSRAAGIPTGWEVVLDLIRKLARMRGEDCEPDPAAWYKGAYGKEPDYAELLEAIAKSPAERSQLLKGYFEPTEEEREQGLKVPTVAHRAIAELVSKGYVRIIVTTNFDRLIEKALEDAGIIPTVISTPDAAEGAVPITHSKCTVLKLHGDYLDTRVKNISTELAQYDDRINRLLDRVFDEFGLVVCGWSAEWDSALRAALERTKSFRFTTYWTARSEPGESAKKLIELRRAQVINIKDANTLFRELAEKIVALEDISKPHPLSAKVAVATLKRYIIDNRNRIHIHDMVLNETEKLYAELTDNNFPVQMPTLSSEDFVKRVQRYEALTDTLLSLLITGGYWGEKEHEGLWARSLERIANPAGERAGTTSLLNLRLYPALLLLYGAGIASIAGDHYGTFAALLTKAKIREGSKTHPLVLRLYTWDVMDERIARQLPGMEKRRTPLSDHLYSVLRSQMREMLPDETQYQKQFDRFEYLYALVHADFNLKINKDSWGPVGSFIWRYHLGYEGSLMKEIETEATEAGANWAPLKAGLFDGSLERFRTVKAAFDDFLKKFPRY